MNILSRLDKLTAKVAQKQQAVRTSGVLDLLRTDPVRLFKMLDLAPDQWQADFLRQQCSDDPHKRVALACARQTGKSTSISLFAALRMMTAGETVAISAPAFRQSLETAQRVRRIIKQLGLVPITKDSVTDTGLANGGRLIVLPSSGATARGFTLNWLAVDEAAYLPVDCDLLESLAPALALADGGIIMCSSPGLSAGLLYEAWQSTNWQKIKVTAYQCPRISAEFLLEQREMLGENGFSREYLADFVTEGAQLVTADQLAACVRPSGTDDWLEELI
jgi:hypothetical protein